MSQWFKKYVNMNYCDKKVLILVGWCMYTVYWRVLGLKSAVYHLLCGIFLLPRASHPAIHICHAVCYYIVLTNGMSVSKHEIKERQNCCL